MFGSIGFWIGGFVGFGGNGIFITLSLFVGISPPVDDMNSLLSTWRVYGVHPLMPMLI